MSLNVFRNDKNLAVGDSFSGLVTGGLKRPSDVRALGGFLFGELQLNFSKLGK